MCFCEPLIFTKVVNLHSALRCAEAPHHCSTAAGGFSAATSHKSTRKPETSVTPNAPSAQHARVHQPQPRQIRADPVATNLTGPTDLRSEFMELPQVFIHIFACLQCTYFIFTKTEQFQHSSGCHCAELHVRMLYSVSLPVPVCYVYMFMHLLCSYVFPVVQTWVLDVRDELASMQVCIGQDVPLEQMRSGLQRACEYCIAALNRHFNHATC